MDIVSLADWQAKYGVVASFGAATSTSPTRFMSGPTLVSVPVPGDNDTGSIIGPIIDLGLDIIRGRVPTLPALPPLPGAPVPTITQQPRSGPGFTLGGAIAPSNGACAPNPCCRGQHLNKSRGCDGSPAGTKCVTNRRMNSLNPKALRRATRRLKGFERAVKGTRKQLRTLARI